MSGFKDGRNLENRSVPLVKLEADVLAVERSMQFRSDWGSSSASIDGRIVVLNGNTGDMFAHMARPISVAHPGRITSTQIAPFSISEAKVNFVVLELGLAENQAARGDHTHDHITLDNLAGLMDLHSTQTVSGVKTFVNNLFIDSQNFQAQDNIINLNANAPAINPGLLSGLEILDPFLLSSVNFVYDLTDNRIKHKTGVTSETFAYEPELARSEYRYRGVAKLSGSGAFTEVILPASVRSMVVKLSIRRQSGSNAVLDVGDLWYTLDPTHPERRFRIYNTGDNDYDYVLWGVMHREGALEAISGYRYRGAAKLAGLGAFTEVTLPASVPNMLVGLSIKRIDGSNTIPNIGDFWYVLDSTQPERKFRIYNTGANNYDYVSWNV